MQHVWVGSLNKLCDRAPDGVFDVRKFNHDIEECHLGPYRRGISSPDDLGSLLCWRATTSSVVSVMRDLAAHSVTPSSPGAGGRRSRASRAPAPEPWFVPRSAQGNGEPAVALTSSGKRAVMALWERLFNGHKATGSSVASKLLGVVPVHGERGHVPLQQLLQCVHTCAWHKVRC